MRCALPVLLAVALAGCSGGDSERPRDVPVGGATASPAATGSPVPIGCEQAVPSTSVPTPRGLVAPRGIRVIAASRRKRPDDPRITVVEGYVERAPSDLVAAFAKQKGIKVLFNEDEGIEAEVLVSDGRYRAFWKVVRACLSASRFTALYSAEKSGGAVAGAAPATKTPIPNR